MQANDLFDQILFDLDIEAVARRRNDEIIAVAREGQIETGKQFANAFGGEYHAEQFGVSAPVRNHNGEVIAALTIRIPPARYESGKLALISAVVQAAARISGRIGYSPDQPGRTMHWASVAGQDALLPVVTSRKGEEASVQVEPPADRET